MKKNRHFILNSPNHTWIRFLLCLCISFSISSLVIGALPTRGEEEIYDRVIRLHVLANSDSEEDQRLKLDVRDAVLTYLNDTSSLYTTADDAENAYRDILSEITGIAQQVLEKKGSPYPCRVTLTRESYPIRTYGNITLPAGTYRSLRICIGEAQGQNWWCVLFPPLCLSLAADIQAYNTDDRSVAVSYVEEDSLLQSTGFTPYEISLISEHPSSKVIVKFRIVEFFRSLLGLNR
ncbi:MAG: stage II sporulation protein R [Clostridia bacterium]|nr:stage II sporulation protein R [Clostridia bacterium]